MAVLGTGGLLEISREIPNPMALSYQRLNIGSTPYTITFASPSYWQGDRIILAADGGLPIDINGNGYADCPDGHGMYRGSTWALGPNRAWYSGSETDNAPFYNSAGNSNSFYNTAAATGLTKQTDAYMSRDLLDRIRLWTTEAAAHSQSGTEKAFINVKPKNFVIARYFDNATYASAIDSAIASIADLVINGESVLSVLITLPAGFHVPCEDGNRDYSLQAYLQRWVLSLDAASLDTTAIGQTFGENIKSLVRGAGSINFMADHRSVAGEQDTLALLRLVMLLQNQCNTKAKFYLYKNRNEADPKIDGSVYYECEIVLTNSNLNTVAGDITTGTADFVATSEIALKVAA
jgi:hypothetical protein|tara:strand:+ start:1659 stop:2705 length:1047 start_codon:yes stop_codon:yes gene_type:complete